MCLFFDAYPPIYRYLSNSIFRWLVYSDSLCTFGDCAFRGPVYPAKCRDLMVDSHLPVATGINFTCRQYDFLAILGLHFESS